ncbi:MAG: hypothetical protein ACLFRO_06135 [Desulfobacterales bacterium]
MKRNVIAIIISVVLAAMISAVPAFAQDKGEKSRDGEATMKVVGPDETPDRVEQRIRVRDNQNNVSSQKLSLPEGASEEGVENSAYGLETANQAREQKGDFGRERARQAPGNEIGERVREMIRDRMKDTERTQAGPENRPGR